MSRWASRPCPSYIYTLPQAASLPDEEVATTTPEPKAGVLIDGFRVSPAVPVILDDVSKLLPPGFNPQAVVTTPIHPRTTPEVPTVPTRGPRTTTRKPTTTTTRTTTTQKPFQLTPLPTEATTESTTQKLYVSTNFFRPTLPTTPDGAEPESSSEIVVVETSSIGNVETPEDVVEKGQEPTISTSFTKVETTSSSQTSSTSSESNYNINNRLDELASNLDPWAHIQHAEHKVCFIF